jgi:transposase
MTYQSNVSRAQFKIIEPLFLNARKQTRPRTYDLYIILNAILYIIKNGCTWRDLPKDFPDYRVVYHYFSIWREQPTDGSPSILDMVLKKIGRERAYQNWQKSLHDHGYCGRTKCSECLMRIK